METAAVVHLRLKRRSRKHSVLYNLLEQRCGTCRTPLVSLNCSPKCAAVFDSNGALLVSQSQQRLSIARYRSRSAPASVCHCAQSHLLNYQETDFKAISKVMPVITLSAAPIHNKLASPFGKDSLMKDDKNVSSAIISESVQTTTSSNAIAFMAPVSFCGSPRARHKGLLESRGAARLTLSLLPGTKSLNPFPTQERCEELAFVASSSNRLSRSGLAIAAKEKNRQALFREFWDIPMLYASKLDLPEYQGIAGKNRYQTIIPNASTRVILPPTLGQEADASTYINANYVRGYAGCPRAFIATQGPLDETVADFWRMVWCTQAPAIVMITALVEKQRSKCALYFPRLPGDEMLVNANSGLTVTTHDAEQHDGWTVRNLTLSNKASTYCHRLRHYWYPLWPDHTTPTTERQLLALVEAVAPLVASGADGKPSGGPVVVHCSAGLGRTGAFCALSLCVQQLSREQACDPLKTVCQLRLDRGGMVQTHEQYAFVHRALHQYAKAHPSL